MLKRGIILLLLVATVAVPFILRPRQASPEEADDTLVIISPHNDAIRHEFSVGFREWYKERTGRTVFLDWRNVGGTSDITRYLDGQFDASFQNLWTSGAGEAVERGDPGRLQEPEAARGRARAGAGGAGRLPRIRGRLRNRPFLRGRPLRLCRARPGGPPRRLGRRPAAPRVVRGRGDSSDPWRRGVLGQGPPLVRDGPELVRHHLQQGFAQADRFRPGTGQVGGPRRPEISWRDRPVRPHPERGDRDGLRERDPAGDPRAPGGAQGGGPAGRPRGGCGRRRARGMAGRPAPSPARRRKRALLHGHLAEAAHRRRIGRLRGGNVHRLLRQGAAGGGPPPQRGRQGGATSRPRAGRRIPWTPSHS